MRTLLNKSLITALALLLTVGVFSGAAWAVTIGVSPTGNNAGCAAVPPTAPCQTIAQAVGLAVAGDTIQIFPGTYNLGATVTIGAALTNLAFVGSGQGATIINGFGIAAGNAILDVQANGVTLQGFTIMGATGAWLNICDNGVNHASGSLQFNPAIRVGTGAITTTGVTIRNVEVTGNDVGIAVCNSSNATIRSNNIHDNTTAAAPNGAGLAILQSNDVTVEANSFFNSPSAATKGVFIEAPGGGTSISNTIRSNTFSGFAGTGAGIGAAIEIGPRAGAPGPPPTPNTIENNTFTIPGSIAANPSVGVLFSDNSADSNTIQDNVFDGGDLQGNEGIRFATAAAKNTTIQRNVFRRLLVNTSPAGGSGIDINVSAAGTKTIVTQNLFSSNTNGITFSVAVVADANANDVFTRNQITGNTVGVRVTVAQANAGNEIFTQNNIEGNTLAGWSFTTLAGVAVANFAGDFLAYSNWWGSIKGPTCPLAATTCNNGAIRITNGDTVDNTAGAPVALTTDPFLPTPLTLATGVFGASLGHAPASLAVSSIRALGLGGHRPGLLVEVRGQGIAGVQLQLFNLGGQMIVNQSATGPRLRWNGLSSSGRTLANGVYLYLVTVRGLDGSVIRSEVRKLVIMR